MKEIVLKLYEFDELSKDSQERIIERERWNVMEQCMDAYDIDYKKSMEAFEDLTDTKVYGWEVGYERYDFSYEFKYKDPIYEHPTDYHRDIFPENLCGKLLFRYSLSITSVYLSGEDNLMVDGYDENNDKVDGVNVYYDQIDEVVYLVKIILEEMEGKDHGESS